MKEHCVRLISYEIKTENTHEIPEHQSMGPILYCRVTSGAIYYVDS